MKAILVNGSARVNGNTKIALNRIEKILQAKGIETEIIDLAIKKLNPCAACYKCANVGKCIQNDDLNSIMEKLQEAKAIVLGSPVYFSNVTSRMQMFIERIGIISRSNGNPLKGKIGASVAIARRQGANFVYAAMNFFFGIMEMPIATSSYWNILIGRAPGDIEKDEEGLKTIDTLAENLITMMQKL